MRAAGFYALGFLFWLGFAVLVWSPTPAERDARAGGWAEHAERCEGAR